MRCDGIFEGEYGPLVLSTFKYQATYCAPKLQAQFDALHGGDREYVCRVLEQTGCLPFFAEGVVRVAGTRAGSEAKL